MSELSDFLLACFAEDEAAAREAADDQGVTWVELYGNVIPDPRLDNSYVAVGPWEGEVGPAADHIARHDPARVLAECDAKRRIVERLADLDAHFADTGRQMPDMRSALLVDGILADLALPYAEHPDYDERWRP